MLGLVVFGHSRLGSVAGVAMEGGVDSMYFRFFVLFFFFVFCFTFFFFFSFVFFFFFKQKTAYEILA